MSDGGCPAGCMRDAAATPPTNSNVRFAAEKRPKRGQKGTFVSMNQRASFVLFNQISISCRVIQSVGEDHSILKAKRQICAVSNR